MKKSNGTLFWRSSVTGQLLAESDFSGTLTREYVYFGGRMVARRDAPSGPVYYFLQDHLGSTRVITNSSGAVVRDSDYYPFGGERVITGTLDDPHKFAGMYYDSASELYYTWGRSYSPYLARWVQPDPLAGSIMNPQSLNRYAYVMNNPCNLVDPLGLDPTCSITIVDNPGNLLTSNQIAAAQMEITNIFKQAGIDVLFGQNNPDFTINLVPQPGFWEAGVRPDELAQNNAHMEGIGGGPRSQDHFWSAIS